ncbi:MAG: MarR family transcriptional regulator [Anaerolineales bacterium]|nr:MarR family transcriptional regulator [Anaerolineales bacterium]
MGTHYQGTPAETAALNTYIKLSRAAEAVTAAINGHLSSYHLTVSQFGVLEALYHLGPLPVGQLGEKILKSSGNMTLVVDNLVKRGLVTRARRTDDRRCIDVHLTPAGTQLIAEIMPTHVTHVVRSLAALTPDEQAGLAALCRKLGLAQSNVAREA